MGPSGFLSVLFVVYLFDLANTKEFRGKSELSGQEFVIFVWSNRKFGASSLLRFAHKTPKNRLSADFLPRKPRSDQMSAPPDNRGFFAASSAKNPQVQQAANRPPAPW
jgi:hypothetical protein